MTYYYGPVDCRNPQSPRFFYRDSGMYFASSRTIKQTHLGLPLQTIRDELNRIVQALETGNLLHPSVEVNAVIEELRSVVEGNDDELGASEYLRKLQAWYPDHRAMTQDWFERRHSGEAKDITDKGRKVFFAPLLLLGNLPDNVEFTALFRPGFKLNALYMKFFRLKNYHNSLGLLYGGTPLLEKAIHDPLIQAEFEAFKFCGDAYVKETGEDAERIGWLLVQAQEYIFTQDVMSRAIAVYNRLQALRALEDKENNNTPTAKAIANLDALFNQHSQAAGPFVAFSYYEPLRQKLEALIKALPEDSCRIQKQNLLDLLRDIHQDVRHDDTIQKYHAMVDGLYTQLQEIYRAYKALNETTHPDKWQHFQYFMPLITYLNSPENAFARKSLMAGPDELLNKEKARAAAMQGFSKRQNIIGRCTPEYHDAMRLGEFDIKRFVESQFAVAAEQIKAANQSDAMELNQDSARALVSMSTGIGKGAAMTKASLVVSQQASVAKPKKSRGVWRRLLPR